MTRGEMPDGGVAANERPHRLGHTLTIEQTDLTIEQTDPHRRVSSVAAVNAAGLGPLAALLLGLLLAGGCGSSSNQSGTPAAPGGAAAATPGGTAAQPGLRATIGVASPAVSTKEPIAPRYTCKGANVSLPLKW